MSLFDKLGEPVFDVCFHQIRRRCAEHTDAAGTEQQEKSGDVGEVDNQRVSGGLTALVIGFLKAKMAR